MADRERLYQALRNADAAGDVDAARKLAAYIRQMDAPQTTAADLKARNPAEYDAASPEYQAKYGPAAVPSTENRVAGLGKFLKETFYTGPRQRLGMVSYDDVAEQRRLDAPLMATTAGKVGYFGGGLVATAPAALIPGVNTAAGAALLGGAVGAAQPSASVTETAQNVALGTVGGVIGQKVGEKAIGWAGKKIAQRTERAAVQQSQNAVRDATLAEARSAGYVTPPSTTNPTVTNRLLESVSGKAQTQQAAAIKNQRVTDMLARKELSLPEGAPLTSETLQAVRSEAGKVYEAVASSGTVRTDGKFLSQLVGLTKQADKIRRDFPNADIAGAADIEGVQTSLLRDQFDAGSALEMVKQLRADANSNLAWNVTDPAKKALGRAQRRAADIVEDQLDRHLRQQGNGDLLQQYRDARVRIAKSYTVENALAEGTGNVNAARLASELKKHRPLSGGLKTAAKFAQVAPRAAAVPNNSAGVSALDAYAAAAGGSMVNPAIFGLPLARIGAREVLLSRPYQNALVTPNYRPNVNALRFLASGAPLAQPTGVLVGTNVGQ